MFPSFLYPTCGHWFQKKSHCGAKSRSFLFSPLFFSSHPRRIPDPQSLKWSRDLDLPSTSAGIPFPASDAGWAGRGGGSLSGSLRETWERRLDDVQP